MSLQQSIEDFKQHRESTLPAAILELISRNVSLTQQAIQQVAVVENAIKVGEKFPAFELQSSEGERYSLSYFLSSGPVIISFYRGGWCPYCVIELKALAEITNQLPALNTELIAVSAELPQHLNETKHHNQLNFSLLRDEFNQLAEACGLVFNLTEELLNQFEQFGIDLKVRSDEKEDRLAIPATFILDQTGIVKYAFVEDDYMTRAEPNEILNVLKSLE